MSWSNTFLQCFILQFSEKNRTHLLLIFIYWKYLTSISPAAVVTLDQRFEIVFVSPASAIDITLTLIGHSGVLPNLEWMRGSVPHPLAYTKCLLVELLYNKNKRMVTNRQETSLKSSLLWQGTNVSWLNYYIISEKCHRSWGWSLA